MSQAIPLTLSALPVPAGIDVATIDELIQLICTYMEGEISTSVSFFLQGVNFPASDQGIFYNQTTNRFGAWNSTLGKYIPVSDLQVGDMKLSVVGGDDPANGWVQLDGRPVSDVAGLSQLQMSNLQTIYGANNNLPKFDFVGGLSNIPAQGSFGAISQPPINPDTGIIGGLAFDAAYVQTQIAALATNCESLDASTQGLANTVQAIRGLGDQILAAFNTNPVNGPTWRIFIGFP